MANRKANPNKIEASKVQKSVEQKKIAKAKRGAVNKVKKLEKKVTKGGTLSPKKKPSASIMVKEAFSELKNRKGHTLQAIRNFIAAKYNCKVNTIIQANMKKFIADEFEAGRIKMMNNDGVINFAPYQRFALVK